MSANILDGRKVSQEVLGELKNDIEVLKTKGIVPGLATVLVGDNPASAVYVRQKVKACENTGIKSFHTHLAGDISQNELLNAIDQLNNNPDVHGIIVQLPLPGQLDPEQAIGSISTRKDVDGLHPSTQGQLVRLKSWKELKKAEVLLPCTPAGVVELLQRYKIQISGKNAVIVGRSSLVGKPLALLLLALDATVLVCHSRTPELAMQTRGSDILIAAVGHPGLIGPEAVKPGAVVIDVGISRTDAGLAGDVQFGEVTGIAGYITPVPGGVGPMTVAMLMRNTVEAAKAQSGAEAQNDRSQKPEVSSQNNDKARSTKLVKERSI